MNLRHKSLIAIAFAILLSSPFLMFSQRKPKPILPGEDWVKLFNGQNLDGWNEVGKEKWTVEDGILHGQGVTKDYGYLQTNKSFKDFQLSLRFKCEGTGNSGVFFHTAFKQGTAEITQGLQFEVDCTIGQHSGGLYGDGRGWIVWPAPENETVIRHNEWNEYLLDVVGNRYRSRMNGVPMVDFTDPSPKSFEGPIALQLHAGGQGDMRFRDIMVRDLTNRIDTAGKQ